MTATYAGQTRSQKDRREILKEIRDKMGNERFSEFLIDTLSEHGASLKVSDLRALGAVWAHRPRLIGV